ncbi:hypothetical protein [Absidia glauca]|uniref:Vacuolar ATPase assembly protein VMA22 n=1 Tax=Absidia glauca TaxID=4829 RepID=A0A168QHB6_ABSGL|nr:hypothetical protein [Absidia glauca]
MPTTQTVDDIDRLESVCRELDDLTLLYLSKLNQYTQSRTTTTHTLEKGFLDLAHAKYTMGAKTISHLSYDERMKAQVELSVDRGSSSTYTLTRPSAEVSAEDSEAVTSDDDQGLRQRKGTTKGQQKDSEEDDAKEHKADKPDSAKKEKKAAKTNHNPLHWFGLLVSPSLRTSQGHFQIATTHLVDLANLVHDLDTLDQQYEGLKNEKRQLLEQQSIDKTTAALASTTLVE